MHGKEFVLDVIRTYFTVVTFVNVVMFLVGTQFLPDYQFGYEAFAAPLIYGVLGTLPNVIMYSRHELTVREVWIRKLLQLIAIEVIVLFEVFYNAGADLLKIEVVICVGVCVLIIYVISTVVDGIQDYLAAKKMTEELMKFQRSVER